MSYFQRVRIAMRWNYRFKVFKESVANPAFEGVAFVVDGFIALVCLPILIPWAVAKWAVEPLIVAAARPRIDWEKLERDINQPTPKDL